MKAPPFLLVAAPAAAQLASPDVFHALDPLVVTGSASAEALKDAPVRTEIIGRDLIESTASRDLAQIIAYTPGMRVETTCSNCNQPSIQLLGLPQSYIALLADGLPTFSGLAGVYGIEQIPAGLIGRVEVVKGGGSTLYGPGAVAGVINLIPREPEATGGILRFHSTLGSGDTVGGDLSPGVFALHDWVFPGNNFALTVFGDYSLLQAADLNSDGFTDVSKRELLSGGLRATWKPRSGTRFSFDYFISEENRRGGETGPAFDGPPNLALIAEEIFSLRQVAALKWEQELTESLKLQTAYAYSRTDRASYYGGTVALGSPDPASPFFDPTWTAARGFGETSSDLHFIDALLIHEISDDHRLTSGVQYRHETLIDGQATLGRAINETYRDLGFLAQHRWKANDLLTAEYGTRVDFHSEVDGAIFSPRASLMIEPSGSLRVRNSLSWGFRAPEVFDEDLHINNVGGDLQTTGLDPDLKEESSITLSIAPEWQINDRWRLEVNGFHTWLDDTFTDIPDDSPATPDVVEFLKTNGGKSTIAGVELNLGYQRSDSWRMEFSWTEQRARFEDKQLVLGDDSFADPLDNPIFSSRSMRTPDRLGLLKVSYTGEHFDAFLGAQITGPMDVPHVVSDPNGKLIGNRLQRSPWFFHLDVGISKTIDFGHSDTLTLNAGIKNLLDDRQNDLERGAFRDADYSYGPAFPRAFHVGAKWEF